MSTVFNQGSFFICLAINLTLLGALVVFGVVIAFRLARFASPRARYVVAVFCFVIATLFPLYLTAIPAAEQAVLIREAAHNDLLQSDPQILDSGVSTELAGGYSNPPVNSFFTRLSTFIHLGGSTAVGAGFVAVWFSVGLLLLGREIVGQLCLMKARHAWRSSDPSLRMKLSWPDSVSLYIHENEGPCTVGLLKPVVVLPMSLINEFSFKDIERVARHELAHVKWRDPLINAIFRMVRALFWPSLPLWYLARVVSAEREAAADREAIIGENSQGNISRIASEYASSLVSIAWESQKESTTSVYRFIATQANDRNGLEDRVQRLLLISTRPTRLRTSIACSVLLFSLGTAVLVPRASQAVTQKQEPGDRKAGEGETQIQIENPPDAPLFIRTASVRVEAVRPGGAMASAPSVELGLIIRPQLTLLNNTSERIRGLALSIVHGDSGYEFNYQDPALTIEPRATVTVNPGGFPFLKGLEQLKIRIVGLRYENGGGWGQHVGQAYAHPLPPGNLPQTTGESSVAASTAIQSSNGAMGATTNPGMSDDGPYATASPLLIDPVKAVEGSEGVAGTNERAAADTGSTTSWISAKGMIHRYGGGMLHKMVVVSVQPIFPASARDARITGTVVIEVMVDENGNVVSTRAQSGPPELWNAARIAARQWKFKPANDGGQPVKMVGELYFRF